MSEPVDVPVLDAQRITKIFSGTVALSAVDFRVVRGRVHALIGENGAGKSTLVKILAGVESPTSGRVLVDGREMRFESTRDARRLGIGLIHQELQLFPDLTVADNLFVGDERPTRWGTIARQAEEQSARDALARLGASVSPRAVLGTLPLGQQQLVEIARALVHDARVLMMDEPTSALTTSEIPVLFQCIRDLTSHGVSIVYISHRLEELLAIADHVTVLRDGRVVGDAPRADVDVPWIVRQMTGRTLAETPPASTAAVRAPLLEVDALALPSAAGRAALDHVSFQVRAGEVLGLYGLMGAGRTELLETLLGVHRGAAGRIRLAGRDLQPLDVGRRVAAGLAMVPEDRQASGLVPTMSVRENMTLSTLGRLARYGYLAPAAERSMAQSWVSALRIKVPALEAPVGTLSGGNQQKVVIARGVMTRPRVLLLDEPTRGVDVAAKSEILEAMRRLAAEGMGVLFATSELAEIRAAATRVLVMAHGRITADLDAAAATPDVLARAASAAPDRETGGRDDAGR